MPNDSQPEDYEHPTEDLDDLNYEEFLEYANRTLLQTYDDNDDTEIEDNIPPPVREIYLDRYTSRKLQLEITELAQMQGMRMCWSDFLLCLTLFIFLFEIALVLLVGGGLLKFEDEWFLRIIITGSFTQILGMPIIVIQFLFNPNSLLFKNKK